MCVQGDPSAVPEIVENIKALLGKKPMFGICMGHQIIGQVVGGKTFKLKFGHHGANHPIRFDKDGVRRPFPSQYLMSQLEYHHHLVEFVLERMICPLDEKQAVC